MDIYRIPNSACIAASKLGRGRGGEGPQHASQSIAPSILPTVHHHLIGYFRWQPDGIHYSVQYISPSSPHLTLVMGGVRVGEGDGRGEVMNPLILVVVWQLSIYLGSDRFKH